MTMHSGNMNTFNAKRAPMMQAVRQLEAAKEILRSDRREDFITVLNFLDPQEATDFALCIYKCRRHGLTQQEERFWLIAKARVAVRGDRAKMYTQTITGNLIAEFFGGKSVSSGNNGSKSKSTADTVE